MAIDVDYETALCARVQYENLVLECAHVPSLFTQFILIELNGSEATCCDIVDTDSLLSRTKEEVKALVFPIMEQQIRLMNESNRRARMRELLSFFAISF